MRLWAVEIQMPVSRAGVGGRAALGVTLSYLSGLQAEEQAGGWNCEAGVTKLRLENSSESSAPGRKTGAGQALLHVTWHCLTEWVTGSRAHLQPQREAVTMTAAPACPNTNYANVNPEWLWPTAAVSHWHLHTHRLWSTEVETPLRSHIFIQHKSRLIAEHTLIDLALDRIVDMKSTMFHLHVEYERLIYKPSTFSKIQKLFWFKKP